MHYSGSWVGERKTKKAQREVLTIAAEEEGVTIGSPDFLVQKLVQYTALRSRTDVFSRLQPGDTITGTRHLFHREREEKDLCGGANGKWQLPVRKKSKTCSKG